ncbi:NHL repeat-containing protein [Streptomyces yaizuensis]|uniref:Delta-60 repeat domain-containing protein n=1 Tax=Streptomyces yaizuensis TaxID=2989713 RepID=A0ABQ5P3T8_9ACTN|nr:hypothetical protein [Streptomyces sp. YSPA8]GLF97264.1 hypothetical protein SYYSPA8_23225 [Streptomyces sp. YSPA8]
MSEYLAKTSRRDAVDPDHPPGPSRRTRRTRRTRCHRALAALPLLAALTAAAPTAPAPRPAGGVVVTEVKGGASVAGIDVFPDGSTVVVATSDGRIIVAKYTPGGKLDPRWGRNGIATVPLDKKAGTAGAAAIGVNGTKVVVAGTVGGDVVVARLTAGGSPDTTFNTTGYRVTDLGGTDDTATGLALGAAGEPHLLANSDGGVAVVRYCSGADTTCAAGAVDHRYGKNGTARFRFTTGAGTDSGAAVALRSDGRADIIGTTRPADEDRSRFAMAALTPRGGLDNAFGTGGKVVTDDRQAIRTGPVMVLDSSERILVAGTLDGRFAVARYTATGAVDRTFATDGVATAATEGTATAITVRNAEITIAGTTPQGMAVALRYTDSGKPGTHYGSHGVARTSLGGDTDTDTIAGVVLDTGGRALLTGTTDRKIAVLRYTTGGTLDTAYG